MEKSLKTYEDYFSQSVEERMLHYEKEGHLQHVMLSHQFPISLMEELFDIADHVKEMTRKPNGIEFLKLSTRMNNFIQNSKWLFKK